MTLICSRARRFLGLPLVLVLLVGVSPMASPVAAAPAVQTDASRAAFAYQAMQTYFYHPDVQLYQDPYPQNGGNPYSYVWPFSQAMAATNYLSGISRAGGQYTSDVTERLNGLTRYWNPTPTSNNPPSPPSPPSPPGYASYVMPPLGQGGNIFYDDNEWVALALIQHYQLTGDPFALSRAEQLFQLFQYGWDTNPSHPCPGGVYWTQASWSHDRNTISNAPAAEVGLHLYLITHQASYLASAKQMYDWVNSCLLAPNGLYWDHIDLAGNINTTEWSYNQGVMLGASVLLFRATGDASYLQRAQQIAQTALNYYGTSGRWYTQDVIFNAIFFKNLLQLYAIHADGQYLSAMRAYSATLWQSVDPRTGLLELQPSQPVPLLNQAGLVQLYALLAWNPGQYSNLA